MSKPGPPPTPSNIKKLRGTYREDRAPDNEPTMRVEAPEPPHWLSNTAKHFWRELAPMLEDLRVVTPADRLALTMLLDAYGEYRIARRACKSEGRWYETETYQSGRMIREHPAVSICHKRWDQIYKMLKEFGLTPSSRTRTEAIKADEGDDKEDFLFGG